MDFGRKVVVPSAVRLIINKLWICRYSSNRRIRITRLLMDSSVRVSRNTIVYILSVCANVRAFISRVTTIIIDYIIYNHVIVASYWTRTTEINPFAAIGENEVVDYYIVVRVVTVCNSTILIRITDIVGYICVWCSFIDTMPKVITSRCPNIKNNITNNGIVTYRSFCINSTTTST